MKAHSEETFLDWLRKQTLDTLTIQDSVHFIGQAADALQEMHQHGKIYCHITPANFYIRPNTEHPGLPDLSLAGSEQSNHIETTGNPLYMAPEQWYGMPVPATDQYALAIIAYQMLTWRSPFQGTWEQLRDQHLHAMPQLPSVFNPHLSSAVDTVVLRALSKKPEDRFPSIAAFSSAIWQTAQVRSSTSNTSIQEIPDTTKSRKVDITSPHARVSAGNREPTVAASATSNQAVSINRISQSFQVRELFMLALVFLLLVGSIGLGFSTIVKRNQTALDLIQAPTYAVATSRAQLAATITAGTPLFADSLSNNTGHHWDEGAICVFKEGTYHVLVPNKPSRVQLCRLRDLALANVAMQVDVSLLSGNDAGLIFRYNHTKWYSFEIFPNGAFNLFRVDTEAEVRLTPLFPFGARSPAITGGKQKNTLLVIANGPNIKLYINRVFVGEIRDSTYVNGLPGFVVVTSPTETNGDASFSNFKVYKV